MIRSRRFVVPAVALCLPGALALAQAAVPQDTPASTAGQRDASALQALEASSAAIAAAEGFGAQFRMFGEGSALIQSTMPSSNGRFVFGRTDEGPVIHMLGEARDTAESEPYPIDFTRTDEILTWTDDTKETVFIRRAKPEPRIMPGAARMIHMINLLDEDPFETVLGIADSVTSEPAQDVAGVMCDVVLLNIPKNSGVQHTSERWFIAKSDRLPRRVEQITDAGMIKFSLVTEMSGLDARKQAPAMLDVRRPENYTIDDQSEPAARNSGMPTNIKTINAPGTTTKQESQNTAKPAGKPEQPEKPARRAAPMFSFTDDAGATIDNNTQIGRVTVLYYWGTWCVPCRAVSPEISKITERFSDRDVDVFALAIRERDPQTARDLFEEKKYSQRLVLDAESTTGPFRIRVYPTVVVIDPAGNIAYKGATSKVRSAEQLAGEIADAIQAALDQG